MFLLTQERPGCVTFLPSSNQCRNVSGRAEVKVYRADIPVLTRCQDAPGLAPNAMRSKVHTASDLVRQAGFEPATRCLEGSRSIRLSYWRSGPLCTA
jgi:hypothetical protein